MPAFPSALRFLPLLFMGVLAACNVASEEDSEAGQNLKNWNGQKVNVLVDQLGHPDQVTTRDQGKFFVWNGKREVANTPYTSSTTSSGGTQTIYAPNRDNTYIAPCRLLVVTDKSGVILSSSFKGTDLGCQPFAEKINAPLTDAAQAHENLYALEGKPLQTALDILGTPEKEISKPGAMSYQWSAVKGDKACYIRLGLDKDGIIRHALIRGNKDACSGYIHALNSANIQNAAPAELPQASPADTSAQ